MALSAHASPTSRLIAAVACCAVIAVLITAWVLQQPWLGLTLHPDGDLVKVAAADPTGPAAGVVPDARLVSLAVPGGQAIALEARDLIEEPDVIESYAAVDRFFERQTALRRMLGAGPVTLRLSAGGQESILTVTPAPRRPLGSLHGGYWAQILVGIGVMLIGMWVWLSNPRMLSCRLFATTGVGVTLAAWTAAVYSSRELALDGGLFQVLSAANHFGALLFGMGMIALFLQYPSELVPRRALWLVPIALIPAWLADAFRLAPGPAWFHLAILTEMILIVVAVLWQWWAGRRDPTALAALRWLGTAVVVCAGAFVAMIVGPVLLGGSWVISQGYSFILFLLIYIGVAIGLRRHRLFAVEGWANTVLFYALGAILLIAVDALLILALGIGREASTGLAILAIAFGWLPLRDTIWARLTGRHGRSEADLFRAVSDVALKTQADRAAAWRDLLDTTFTPLTIAAAVHPVAKAEIVEDGVAMLVPAGLEGAALKLSFPRQGRGLFRPADAALADQMAELLRHLGEGRDAYIRGVFAERRRIASDLHDDVGSRLVAGLHASDPAQVKATMRAVMADIRTIVSGLTGASHPLAALVSDLRLEADQRLGQAGIALHWPPGSADEEGPEVSYAHARHLTAILRELTANIIKHAHARQVEISAEVADGTLHLTVENDGVPFDPTGPGAARGHGMANLRARIAEAGGSLSGRAKASGCRVSLALPLARAGAPAARAEAVERKEFASNQ